MSSEALVPEAFKECDTGPQALLEKITIVIKKKSH